MNEIITLYPKNAKGIIKWIIDGLYSKIDNEKALRWIEALRPHAGTTIAVEELNDVAKVVRTDGSSNNSDEDLTEINGSVRCSGMEIRLGA